jgi:glyoxylase-like metal-dependent hydrolase (beta-lactamase superfamily II)
MSVIVGDEIAIVGDTMVGTFPGKIFPPFADDVEGVVQSWGKLLETGCRLFLPAHGSGNSRELVEKLWREREQRESAIEHL